MNEEVSRDMTGEAGGKNPGVDYAKDNRTTHLIARSDKSVDYVGCN